MKKLLALILSLALLAAAMLSFSSCAKKDDKTIIVGASSTPHAEILEVVKPLLEAKGYTLDIRVYSDYVLPNTSTESGDLDANYFQHTPYLDEFNASNGTHLVSVAKIHYEPYGIYAGTSKSLSEIPDGATIIIPNDGSNEARALYLLEANGLLTMKEGTGMTATVKEIAENPHNYDVKEFEAALIPSNLTECAVAVINGNYAIEAGLSVKNALAVEDKNSTAAQTYANILVVKEGNEKNAGILALAEALQSEEVRTFIESTYDGAVVPIF